VTLGTPEGKPQPLPFILGQNALAVTVPILYLWGGLSVASKG
jgi:hypothetical protein